MDGDGGSGGTRSLDPVPSGRVIEVSIRVPLGDDPRVSPEGCVILSPLNGGEEV